MSNNNNSTFSNNNSNSFDDSTITASSFHHNNEFPNNGCQVLNSCTNIEVPNVACFPQTAKVPVVLAEPTLQICLQSTIKLECAALEIKRVRKDACIARCKLVPTCSRCIFKFFINGFIRKNIEYATVSKINPQAICGEIRHTTVQIPYSACTELRFPRGGPFPIFTRTEEAFYEFSCLHGMGPKMDEKLFENDVYYNDPPYCELVCANFQEFDIGNTEYLCDTKNPCAEDTFEIVHESIVMDLRVKILQRQQIALPAWSGDIAGGGCCPHENDCE